MRRRRGNLLLRRRFRRQVCYVTTMDTAADVCMYVCIYVHISNELISMHVCRPYEWVYVLYVHMNGCMYLWMYLCVKRCCPRMMYVCMYIYIHRMYVYIHTPYVYSVKLFWNFFLLQWLGRRGLRRRLCSEMYWRCRWYAGLWGRYTTAMRNWYVLCLCMHVCMYVYEGLFINTLYYGLYIVPKKLYIHTYIHRYIHTDVRTYHTVNII